MSKKTLTRLEIKQAILTDGRFRELFPELSDDIRKILNNPGCACNAPMLDKFFKYKDRLLEYFSNRDIKSPQEQVQEDNQNHWTVINCKVEELESVLNKLHKFGRKQIAVARYENDLTVIVNDMGIMF